MIVVLDDLTDHEVEALDKFCDHVINDTRPIYTVDDMIDISLMTKVKRAVEAAKRGDRLTLAGVPRL